MTQEQSSAGLVEVGQGGNRLEIEKLPKDAPPILGADGQPLNQKPTYAIAAGVLLIRVLPMRSDLNVFGVDPHAVPLILRGLADSYEEQHAESEHVEGEGHDEAAPEGDGQGSE